MKIRILLNLILLLLCVNLSFSQTGTPLEGEVSYKSSQNIYVKLSSTSNINIGDTLYIKNSGEFIPGLIVNNKSSISCVCTSINESNIEVKDKVYFLNSSETKTEIIIIDEPIQEQIIETIEDTVKISKEKKRNTTQISGKIAASSYSDFSNTDSENSQRMKYTLSLKADNLGVDNLSAETYISFRHKVGEWEEVKSNVNSALKIYNLSASYNINENINVTLGRKINHLISNLGATDGIQFQGKINNIKVGAIVGTRPDYSDYSFNKNLFQFGTYLAHEYKKERSYMRNSFAFIQQMNNSNTDRRFIYLQHQNQLLKKLYFFTSFEVDLFKRENDVAKSTIDLTGFYFMSRYQIKKNLSITASYDARKQVIYYETYKNFLEELLDQETRQGYRVRLNYKPWKWMTMGLNAGYRFRKDDPSESKNIHYYIRIKNLSQNSLYTTISSTHLKSSYINSNFYGVRLAKDLFKGKLRTGLGYKYVDNFYLSSEENILQDMIELNVNWRIIKKLSLSVNYEFYGRGNENYNRLYIQLRQRF